jgi:iron complex outermembrane recepter protein
MKPSSNATARLLWFAATLPLTALSVLGQTATPTSTRTDDTEEPVTLSPFVVSDRSEEGYYSPQAVSGTRTRTELINLPLNLTVFNENFINDIGARDLVDVVSFASGVSGGGTAASDSANGDTLGFILRGQGGFVPNRNGFRRLRVVDPATISRVEILKGPSSVLYGQASPGGSVNYITKRPVQRKFFNTSVQVGSYEFYKATVDINVPTPDKKLAVRFVGAYEDSESWIARYHNKQTVLYPSITWWIRPETTLTVEFESTKRRTNPQSPLPYHPLIDLDSGPAPIAVNRTWNARGKHDFLDVTMQAFTVELVHKLNENLTFRANWSDVDWDDNVRFNSPSAAITSIAGGLPSDPPMMQGRTFSREARGSFDRYRQIELLNNFELGAVKVQNLLGYQHGQEKFVGIYKGISPPIDNLTLWNLNDPSTWVLTERFNDLGSAITSGQRFRNTINSGYFVNQLTLLGDRLHTLAGVRIDKIESDNYANANSPTPVQSYAEYPTKTSPQVGVLYKVIPSLSIFANYSTSIVNLYTTLGRRPDGSSFNPVPGTGKGYDFGVKTDMFKGVVSGVMSIYSLEEKDIVRTLPTVTIGNETFTPIAQSGVNSSSGAELDVMVRPTSKTQIGFGYAYTYAYVKSDEGTAIALNGVRTLTRENHQLAYSPNHQFSANFRQDLGKFGALNNVYVTANGKWMGERTHTEAWVAKNGVLTAPWTLDPYTVVSVGVGAQFNVGRASCNASVMIKNVFDEDYLASRNYWAAPRTIELTLRASF